MIITDIRIYRAAIEQAERIGVSRESAVQSVAIARKHGDTGYHVSGFFRKEAMRSSRVDHDDPPPRAA